MKVLISPAKSLNLESKIPTELYTIPRFLEQTKIVHETLKEKSIDEISKLMNLSPKLSELNYTRFQNFTNEHKIENSRPAIYTFDGDVYTGLNAFDIPKRKIDLLQNTVRILSGMYGLLKPLDLIQPYRLEMGTKIAIQSHKNLYSVWKNSITTSLNEEISKNDFVINLASNEYYKAIQTKSLKANVITPVFKEWKNGTAKVISFYAKKARGMMTRYIIDIDAKTIDDLKAFNYGNYHFSDEFTSKTNEIVFIR